MEQFGKLEPQNDNEQLRVGDWVTITNERDARLVKQHLQSEPPYVIARIGPKVANLIARKDRETITGKKPDIETNVANMTHTETPSYGIPTVDLQRFDRVEIVRE